MAWLILVGYPVGWLLCGWWFSVGWLDAEVRSGTYLGHSAAEEAAEWRGFWVGSGFLAALVWPLVLPIEVGRRLVTGKFAARLFVTAAEREDAARRELEALRRQARDLGLPMPNLDQDQQS